MPRLLVAPVVREKVERMLEDRVDLDFDPAWEDGGMVAGTLLYNNVGCPIPRISVNLTTLENVQVPADFLSREEAHDDRNFGQSSNDYAKSSEIVKEMNWNTEMERLNYRLVVLLDATGHREQVQISHISNEEVELKLKRLERPCMRLYEAFVAGDSRDWSF